MQGILIRLNSENSTCWFEVLSPRGTASLEAVSTKIDTTRPTQKLDRCLKFRNDLNLPVLFCCIVILKTEYDAFNLSITALF